MSSTVDNNSPNKANVLFDLDALKAMNDVQRVAMLMQMLDVQAAQIQKLTNQVSEMTKRFGNTESPKRTIVGSEFVDVTVHDEHAIISIDEDALREANPPLPTGLNLPICDGGDTEQIGAVGEGAEAVDAETFLHDGTNGVVVYVMTRVYYDHTATSPVLYGYQRPLLFDRNGNLCQVGAEERYTIDTPEECEAA